MPYPRVLLLLCCLAALPGSSAYAQRYNVLFLFVDDLRPELGCYGNTVVQSPHIDRLAANGTVFYNHYVVVPTCGASRAALLTGMRPRKAYELSNDILELRQADSAQDLSRPESFIAHFRNQGYYTAGIGKISHSADGYLYKYLEPKSNILELPRSWDEMLFNPGKWGTGWNAFFGYANGNNRNTQNGEVKPYEAADVKDEDYPDGLTAALAVQKLRELQAQQKPFFLGVGFFKPHLPFNAPKKYWDLYDRSTIPLAPYPQIPQDINPASLQASGEFNGYKQGEEKAGLSAAVSDDYARTLRHAYFASISYVDAQVGKVLAALDSLGLRKNTIVVLWGDHGWHLGDDRVWGKHTLSEWALRSPLIISMPGNKSCRVSRNIVSSVDIFPTLMEHCGLPLPSATDGISLLPLLRDAASASWVDRAYSYFNKGITVRTERYRLTRYFRQATPTVELYDYVADPFETRNIATVHPEVVQQLMPMLDKGNTGIFR